MRCMYAQTRPRFILSSEGVLEGMEFEPMLTPREKSPLPKMSPEEDRTRDAVDTTLPTELFRPQCSHLTFMVCRAFRCVCVCVCVYVCVMGMGEGVQG